MARKRRKKKKDSPLELLIDMSVFIITSIMILIISLIKFLYDVLIFHLSGYEKKSGNGFFKTYFNKGNKGEFILYWNLIRIFGKQFVFTNIYLDNINTDKTEVDCIVVSNKKIYVFEMKNYRGMVYGSQHDTNWTQVFNRFSKYQFYNPIRQNYAHTKAVEKYLTLNIDSIEPVVVFSNSSKLKKVNINPQTNVIQIRELRRYIRNIERNYENIFTDEEKVNMAKRLILVENVSQEVKDEHIRQVQEHVKKQNEE